MKITLKDKNGVILQTANKFCKENVEVRVQTEELTVTPSTEEQVKEGLYNKVTVAGDSNLVADNIKEGISIFGVEGNAKTSSAKITDGSYLFYKGARVDNAQQILNLCDKINSAQYMFQSCTGLEDLDVSNLDTSEVTDMRFMFYDCKALTELDVSNWDTSKVTSMYCLFSGCNKITNLDVSKWNTSNVTAMNSMFYSCYKLAELDLSSFNTSNVTNMEAMFATCQKLEELDLSKWNTSNVTAMQQLFSNCSSLISIDVSSFDTSKVPKMYGMFQSCAVLPKLDLSKWNTSNVTDMQNMFKDCYKLAELDVSSFNTSNVTNMNSMFNNCYVIEELDLRNWDTSKVTNMSSLFNGCKNLKKLYLTNFTFDKVTSYSSMFNSVPNDCEIVVKSNVEKEWILSRKSTFTNIKFEDEMHLKSIEINYKNYINIFKTKNAQIKITYNGGDKKSYFREEEKCVFTITGNATIDENGLITLNDNVQTGDTITVTATSIYDNSITATKEIEVIYDENYYEVDLNDGQWVDSGERIDGNIVYKSDVGSYNIDSGKSIATIEVEGLKYLKLYIRSYAQDSFDYTEAFAVDTEAIREKGLYNTARNQSPTDYVECIYELDGKSHTIQVMYSKNSFSNQYDDRGYFYIGEYN